MRLTIAAFHRCSCQARLRLIMSTCFTATAAAEMIQADQVTQLTDARQRVSILRVRRVYPEKSRKSGIPVRSWMFEYSCQAICPSSL